MAKCKDMPGLLKMVPISEGQEELFKEYMEKIRKNKDFDVLINIFGIDMVLEFCDAFSGRTIKIPKRTDLYKIILYIRIYSYVKNRGFDERAINDAAKHFSRRTSSIVRIYTKVDKILTSDLKEYVLGDEDDDDDEFFEEGFDEQDAER